MNPYPPSRIWDIPPPPGTEDFAESEISTSSNRRERYDQKATKHFIDRIDPFLKSAEYADIDRKLVFEPPRHRSRSQSWSRERRYRKRHSRSRSKERYRRSRSRSRRRRRRHSSSKSRSRSPGYHHNRHRYGKHRRSSSRHSKSRSTSRNRRKSHRTKIEKGKKSSTSQTLSAEQKNVFDADTNEIDMKIEEEEEDSTKDNVFKNDGSFLEMFKKLQEQEQQKTQETVAQSEETKKPLLPAFGKRRGGKVLKTGMVQKVRQVNDEENNAQDAWSVYMKEVRRYKEACCDDDSKTRPLVK